jgi:hypothetical protein
MKADLDDMKKRIEALEKRKPAVDIHGDVNLVLHAGHSTDDTFGITVDARPTGFGRGDYFGDPVGITRDLTIGHEAAFTFSGTNDTGPKWHATLVVGNLIGFADDEGVFGAIYGNQVDVMYQIPFAEPNESVYFQDFTVDLDSSLFGQNFTAQLGRIGFKTHPMFLWRPDHTPYFENDRWDNGNWYFDGGVLMFDWGNVDVDIWGGRQSNRFATGGLFANDVWPMRLPTFRPELGYDTLTVDQHLGMAITFDLGGKGSIMGTYMLLDGNVFATDPINGDPYNRVEVIGAAIDYNISSALALHGGWGKTNYKENGTDVTGSDNTAWFAELAYDGGRWSASAGYARVEAGYAAPGSWGRIGFYWNPTEIEGFWGNLMFNVGANTELTLSGAFFEDITSTGVYWFDDSKLISYEAKLSHTFSNAWSGWLGWEYFAQDVDVPGDVNKPNVNWYRIGLKWAQDENSSLNFMYEMSNLDSDGNTFYVGEYGAERKGGLFTIQWKRKF